MFIEELWNTIGKGWKKNPRTQPGWFCIDVDRAHGHHHIVGSAPCFSQWIGGGDLAIKALARCVDREHPIPTGIIGRISHPFPDASRLWRAGFGLHHGPWIFLYRCCMVADVAGNKGTAANRLHRGDCCDPSGRVLHLLRPHGSHMWSSWTCGLLRTLFLGPRRNSLHTLDGGNSLMI